MLFAPLLLALRALVKYLAHLCLIPVLAVLKGAESLTQHLIAELSRI